ncbi:MAG: ATP-binding cassette domain-containing protein [Candidatus Heimdallarchaeota archaeon]|nr:ATP-binding cassette domain-containing protein [Candidatus Heimdallarchaeota archaeon]
MNDNDIVIATKNLSKNYGEIRALNELTLKVTKNSIFGFLGPNGAGKTTTIKLLLGLIKPTKGRALVFGKDVVEESLEIRTRIGYLSQEPRFYEHMTAREILAFTLRFYYSGAKGTFEERIKETLELVNLHEKADRPIKGFSSGERQRLGIGQAIIHNPELLIMDEPAASLDPIGREKILSLMERLREEVTIFYSTHILDDVQRVSDQVAILNHGELVAQGSLSELDQASEITYQISIRGDTRKTKERVEQQPWISDIVVQPQNGNNEWLVTVSNQEKAEKELLRLILEDKKLRVTSFRRKAAELEEVFLKIVGG